jgi:ATP phosphoribosyltransferase regulatory subunit
MTPAERFALRLRELFTERGYTRYEMNKFEEYELYAANREFFGGDIITFTGAGGKLMAMRPDVTLSIVKNVTPLNGQSDARVYYHENVYRRAGLSREFRELAQCGVECIGDVGEAETAEVLALAWDSLMLFGGRCILDVSHVGFADIAPFGGYGRYEDVVPGLDISGERAESVFRELDSVIKLTKRQCPDADIRLDFELKQDLKYYNGVIFKGYAEGYPSAVLSGGRYDTLMLKFGKDMGAAGFSVYADMYRSRTDD